jgi:hypothetical protein
VSVFRDYFFEQILLSSLWKENCITDCDIRGQCSVNFIVLFVLLWGSKWFLRKIFS